MNKDTHGATGQEWYGFDLDGTLAKYDGWKGEKHIGEPVAKMVDLAKKLHSEGKKVKIFTARVAPTPDGQTRDTETARKVIEDWCAKHLGFVPEVTCVKDALMKECYDDRSVQVIPNEGESVESVAVAALEAAKKRSLKALAAEVLAEEDCPS